MIPSSTSVSPSFKFVFFCFFNACSSCSCVIVPVSTSKSPSFILRLLKSTNRPTLFYVRIHLFTKKRLEYHKIQVCHYVSVIFYCDLSIAFHFANYNCFSNFLYIFSTYELCLLIMFIHILATQIITHTSYIQNHIVI